MRLRTTVTRRYFRLNLHEEEKKLSIEWLRSYPGKFEVLIIDELGCVQQSYTGLNRLGNLEIDVQTWLSGIYFVELRGKAKSRVENVTIRKERKKG